MNIDFFFSRTVQLVSGWVDLLLQSCQRVGCLMGCYQFTGSLSAVRWCAYMMDWLLSFSCDEDMWIKKQSRGWWRRRDRSGMFLKMCLNCLKSQIFHGDVSPQINWIWTARVFIALLLVCGMWLLLFSNVIKRSSNLQCKNRFEDNVWLRQQFSLAQWMTCGCTLLNIVCNIITIALHILQVVPFAVLWGKKSFWFSCLIWKKKKAQLN